MTKTPREIELKLELDADAVAGLLAHPLLAATAGEAPARLTSVYFDTADQALRAEGLSLRVRQQGERRVQTLKVNGGDHSGLFDRGEWEADIAGERPDYEPLRDTPVRELLSRKAFERDLRPAFISRVERTTHPVSLADAELSVTVDRGEVRAGDMRVGVCEVEIELARGEPSSLFAVAQALAQAAPLRLSVISKADRGYSLLAAADETFVKAHAPALEPGASATEAFQAIARACLRHFFLNEALYVAHADAEALHQMRVALRRLRAAMSVMAPLLRDEESRAVKAALKEAASALGAARNLDVVAQDVLPDVAAALPQEPGLAALARTLDQQRVNAARAAAAAVRSPGFAATMLRLVGWVECGAWREHETGSAQKMASRILSKRRKRVLRHSRDLAALAPPERHAVRIAVKKLRYAAEFFLPLFDAKSGKAHPFIAACAALQERLGVLNDDAVAAELLRGWPARQKAGVERAVGLVEGFTAGRQERLVSHAQAAQKALRKAPRFW